MQFLMEIFGALMDALIGRSDTTVYTRETKNTTFKMRPSVNNPELDIGVQSRQIVYKTVFDRWWVPTSKRTIYEVVGYAPDEYKAKFDPRLFEPVTYPILCLRMLKWTEYPHVYAIRAYLDRVPSPDNKPHKVTL